MGIAFRLTGTPSVESGSLQAIKSVASEAARYETQAISDISVGQWVLAENL
ncbi:MAG: hypothetical protein R3C28_24135 [Pirellulaceae bacterium]